MLLIHCPYCGERPEIEFSYGGQAHLARPAQPGGTVRRRMGGVPVPARQPARPARRALAPRARLRALLQCAARHDHRPLRRHLQDRGERAVSAFRTANGGRIDRARTLRFRFDGAAYEGLAGDTLASALLANGVHLVGRSFKYHRPRGIVTAGARGTERARDRAPRRGARDAEPARDAGRALRRARGAFAEPLAEPRLRPRPRERLPLADLPGGLLLQDLHVAARGLGGALRAADPPRRGPRPRAVAAGPGPVRAALCALRRARRRRGARPGSPPRSRPPRAARA